MSFVGGHPVRVFKDCFFDEKIRKYRGGIQVLEIPYSGKLLNAFFEQEKAPGIVYEGVEIPTQSPLAFTGVDELPDETVCKYCIVSALYAAACKELGKDTSRLLTIGSPVVDDDGHVIGTTTLNRN